MKITLVLGLAAALTNATVVRRQEQSRSDMAGMEKSTPKLAGKAPPPLTRQGIRQALTIENIIPQINPEAKRIRMIYGPYKIRAANVRCFQTDLYFHQALISVNKKSWKHSFHGSTWNSL